MSKKYAHTSLSDDQRAVAPPDSMPNSEVKRCIADGSVGSPHVRVGHCQALFFLKPVWFAQRVFFMLRYNSFPMPITFIA